MANWIITAPNTGNDRWAVRLADCTRAHADTVVAQLENDRSVPDRLVLRRDRNYPRPAAVKTRTLFDRLLRRDRG